jgi:hypothetical protein
MTHLKRKKKSFLGVGVAVFVRGGESLFSLSLSHDLFHVIKSRSVSLFVSIKKRRALKRCGDRRRRRSLGSRSWALGAYSCGELESAGTYKPLRLAATTSQAIRSVCSLCSLTSPLWDTHSLVSLIVVCTSITHQRKFHPLIYNSKVR